MASDNDDKSDNYLSKYFLNLANFQYDKAKTYIDKFKENSKIWSLIQSSLNHLLNGEKFYNNLLFVNQRTISRQDKNYEPASQQLELVVRECLAMRSCGQGPANLAAIPFSVQALSLFDTSTLIELCTLLGHFIEFRFQMMSLYVELKDKNISAGTTGGTSHIEAALKRLGDVEATFESKFTHSSHITNHLNSLYNLETKLLRNVLECHLAIDSRLDCIKSLTTLKDIGDVFDTRLPSALNNKQSKESKGFSLFSRNTGQQRTLPVLYQWFRIYYQSLLNKFSMIRYDSFQRVTDVDHIMNERIDVFTKIVAHAKKSSPCMWFGIVLDAAGSNLVNFRGQGYELLNVHEQQLQQTTAAVHGMENCYPILFSYPKSDSLPFDSEKHMRNLIALISNDAKYFSDQTLKSTYYIGKCSERLFFFVVYELNRLENRAKTSSFVQEIADDLNLNLVLNCFNSNLR